MPLPTVLCSGKSSIDVTVGETTISKNLFFECIKVKKVFDEFGLRDCVEGIEFEVEEICNGGTIDPILILRNCMISNVSITDASLRSPIGAIIEKRLRFAGTCCCDVYGKNQKGRIVKLDVTSIPPGTKFSIGADGSLCFSFVIRREYTSPNTISDEDFERLLHFIDEGRFELQCISEAIIDDENNEVVGGTLVTNLGLFIVVKLDTEVQLCIPTLGYCEVFEDVQGEENFCADIFPLIDFPDVNPPQLQDETIFPY